MKGLFTLGQWAISRAIKSLWGDREGSAIVEASLLAPVLFSLVLGAFEFSWYFYKQQLIEIGVRDAARYLARTAPDDSNPCTDVVATRTVSGQTNVVSAKNIAVYGAASSTGATARVTGWGVGAVTIACPSIDNSAGTYTGATTIYSVTATTTFADPALGFFGFLGLTAPNITAAHTERSIGPG